MLRIIARTLPIEGRMLQPLVTRLSRVGALSTTQAHSIGRLPHRLETLESGECVEALYDAEHHVIVVLKGFLGTVRFHHRKRQVVALHVPGDMIELHRGNYAFALGDLRAMARSNIALIARSEFEEMAKEPSISNAIGLARLISLSIANEWISRLARWDAGKSLAQFLCELGVRLESIGQSERHCFLIPLTQGDLASVVGITHVHLNRVLRSLRSAGLVDVSRGSVRIDDWNRLAVVSGFDPAYLGPIAGFLSDLPAQSGIVPFRDD